jgi:glycosyltransferase involved in cell wall biosynthesis
MAMGLADAITVQFSRYSGKYPTFLQKKIWVIPNAVPKIEESPSRKSQEPTFLFAGRFSFQKKAVELVDAFSEHLQNYPNSKLRIYGSGEKKHEIQNAISVRGIQNSVQILAPERNILNVFRTGDCICVPSIWEGFPNVLAEALSFGIPGIGFSNCDGVSDLLEDNVNGWVEFDDGNNHSLVKLLNRAAFDLSRNHLMALNCKNSVSKYSQDEISNMWNDLIEFVVNK